MPGRLPAVLLLAFASGSTGAANAHNEYTLRYDAGTETMSVRLCVPRASPSLQFSADRSAASFVESLTRDGGPAPERDAHGWTATDWRAGECLAYRAAFGRMVAAKKGGWKRFGALIADPDVWLLRADGGDDTPAEASVELPAGYTFSTPWHPLPSHDGAPRYSIPPTPRDWLAAILIGHFDEESVALPGSTVRLTILDANDAEKRKLEAWFPKMGRAAATAFGTLPLADVQVLIVPADEAEEAVQFGQSRRGQGQGLTLYVDAKRPAADFDHDWVAVHELSHMYHPYLDEDGSWLAEGLATYYQNVLRARAGLLTPAEAWEQIDAGFERGRRETKEQSGVALEKAHGFMRVYWSGTAYWLDVDTTLRRASGNRLSIDEALKRFDACCLPDSRGWTPQAFVAKLDALLGTDVFAKRYAAYRTRLDFPDLAPLYADLGIRRDGKALRFDDDAPAADVRRAITAQNGSKPLQ
ncbi:MAG TPA: hypothetical protein VKB52_00165 [Rhodanobacteraceae bacterium]|nr:hypothetical protein [Rhodanobacteraceae bacterium]